MHEKGLGLVDAPPVERWERRWEADRLPSILPRFDLTLRLLPDFLYWGEVLVEEQGWVVVTLLHSPRDLALAMEAPEDQRARTLYVTTDPNLLGTPGLKHLVMEPWPPAGANCSLVPPAREQDLVVHLLWTLQQRQLPTLLLPPGLPWPPLPHKSADIAAGRISGSSGPSLQYIWLPGSLEAFTLLHGLADRLGVGPFLWPPTYSGGGEGLHLGGLLRREGLDWTWI